MHRLLRFAAATILAFAALPAAAATITDARGRTVEVGTAKRIVSIGGSVSETLAALGVEDRVIAVDSTSKFPTSLRSKPDVGYMRALNAEGVLALGPDLVLALEGSGPADTIDVLTRSSVPVVIVPEARTADGVRRKIEFIADAVGESARGKEIAATVQSDIDALEKQLDGLRAKRRAIFVLAVGNGAPTAAGRQTAADAMFTLAHVDNALGGFNGYKTVVDESAIAAAPEAVVMMSERGHDSDAVLGLPAFAGTPAARDKKLVTMSGTYLLGFGPRTAHAARDLAAAIYPEKALPELPKHPWTQDAPAP
jgi:iron complex transport system substrate-binding protein